MQPKLDVARLALCQMLFAGSLGFLVGLLERLVPLVFASPADWHPPRALVPALIIIPSSLFGVLLQPLFYQERCQWLRVKPKLSSV